MIGEPSVQKISINQSFCPDDKYRDQNLSKWCLYILTDVTQNSQYPIRTILQLFKHLKSQNPSIKDNYKLHPNLGVYFFCGE